MIDLSGLHLIQGLTFRGFRVCMQHSGSFNASRLTLQCTKYPFMAERQMLHAQRLTDSGDQYEEFLINMVIMSVSLSAGWVLWLMLVRPSTPP